MSDGMFSSDFPDVQELIKSLDVMNENVNKAVREGVKEGAGLIEKEQKRLISSKSERLAGAISKSRIFVNKKGQVGVRVGYQGKAFRTDEKGRNAGIAGMVFEFGRPGKRGDTMTQVRNGNSVEVKIGAVQPEPHIGRGLDNKKNEAAALTFDKISSEIEKIF